MISEESLGQVLSNCSDSLVRAVHDLDKLGSLAGESHTAPEEHASKLAYICLSTSASIEEALVSLNRTTKHNMCRCRDARTSLDAALVEMRENSLPELQWFLRTQWFRLFQAGTEGLYRFSLCFAKIIFNGRSGYHLMTERELNGLCTLAAPLLTVLEEICGTIAGGTPPPVIEPEPERMNSLALPLVMQLAAGWCSDVGRLQDRLAGCFAVEQRLVTGRMLELLEGLRRTAFDQQRWAKSKSAAQADHAFRVYSARRYTIEGLPECNNRTLSEFTTDFRRVWRAPPRSQVEFAKCATDDAAVGTAKDAAKCATLSSSAHSAAAWHARQFVAAQLRGMGPPEPSNGSSSGAAPATVGYTADGLVVYDIDLEQQVVEALERLELMTTRSWFDNPPPNIRVQTLDDDEDTMRILLKMGLSQMAAKDFMEASGARGSGGTARKPSGFADQEDC